MNDLRRATRFGDDAGAADAAARLANLLGVDLGNVEDKSATDILSQLGEKLGVSGEATPTSVEQAVMDTTQRQELIGKISVSSDGTSTTVDMAVLQRQSLIEKL